KERSRLARRKRTSTNAEEAPAHPTARAVRRGVPSARVPTPCIPPRTPGGFQRVAAGEQRAGRARRCRASRKAVGAGSNAPEPRDPPGGVDTPAVPGESLSSGFPPDVSPSKGGDPCLMTFLTAA